MPAARFGHTDSLIPLVPLSSVRRTTVGRFPVSFVCTSPWGIRQNRGTFPAFAPPLLCVLFISSFWFFPLGQFNASCSYCCMHRRPPLAPSPHVVDRRANTNASTPSPSHRFASENLFRATNTHPTQHAIIIVAMPT